MIWPLNKLATAFRNLAVSDSFLVQNGQPQYTDWTVQRAVKDGYKINGWVYRAVYLIIKAVAQIEWRVVNEDGEPIEHHLNNVFKRPNPYLSRQNLFELITSWLELAGNSYLYKTKVQGKTVELWPVSPDRMAPIPAKKIDEWIAGYDLDKKRRVVYQPEQIIHHRFLDPSNPYVGISPLQAAAKSVDIDNDQQNFNKTAMANRGVVDGIMSFDRAFNSQDDADAVAQRINERMAGPANARKIGVVGSNAKYLRLGLSPAELDFINSRKFNREEIFIIFGIPPVYAGVTDAMTYNNYTTSELVFWFQTIIPLLDDLMDTFNLEFEDELSESTEVAYNLSGVKVLRKAMTEWTKTAKVLHSMGVPFEQLNKVFEFGFNEFEGWDKSNVSNNNANVTIDNDDAERKQYTFLEFRADMTEDIEKSSGKNAKKIDKLLKNQKKEIFEDLTEDNVHIVIENTKQDWIDTITDIYMKESVKFGKKIVVEKRSMADDIKAAMDAYLLSESIVLTEVSNILNTTATAIIEQISDGIINGMQASEIQQAILDTGILDPSRALMLSRTITGTAANVGQIKAAIISGATHKTWRTASTEVRESHIKMKNKKVGINDYFIVGNEKAMFPLDNNLSPKERVNCRCTLMYSIE